MPQLLSRRDSCSCVAGLFVPIEDQGYFFVQVQTPPGATQRRTQAALDDVSEYLQRDDARMVDATFR